MHLKKIDENTIFFTFNSPYYKLIVSKYRVDETDDTINGFTSYRNKFSL